MATKMAKAPRAATTAKVKGTLKGAATARRVKVELSPIAKAAAANIGKILAQHAGLKGAWDKMTAEDHAELRTRMGVSIDKQIEKSADGE